MSEAQPPVVEPDEHTQPSFDALSAGTIVYQRCTECRTGQLGRADCVMCGGALEWVSASGRGTVCSFTRIHVD